MARAPADMTQLGLYAEEALRGDRQACRVRWLVQALIGLTLLGMIVLNRYPQAARWGLALTAVAALSNLWLFQRLRRGRFAGWTGYVFASLDLVFLTAYTYLTSIYVSPLAVVTFNTLPVYCMLLVFVSLRQDRRLLIYCTSLSLILIEGLYWLRYPALDQGVLAHMVSADPLGTGIKGVYLLAFGAFLLLVPRAFDRLLGRQAQLFEERRQREEGYRAHLEQEVASRTAELNQANLELQAALAEVQTLSGLLPICTECKKIRDDHGYWQGVEDYIRTHSQADFTHGICPDCLAKTYPEVYERLQGRREEKEAEAPPVDPPTPRKDGTS